MRSTLKKSLYLGLAALSFASVAGAANNADAAKKAPAKTYATASYQNIPDQGQSNVAYNVTGSNALFNKPGTVKGAKQVASKATMSDLASSKQNFMVYQTATTNRGSKYIKVVSFDKQYRGWIYAGNNTSSSYGTGVQQINLATNTSPQYSSVYLSNPGQTALKSSPEGSQFNASQDTFAHTGFVASDSFTVDAAQTVNRTGTTWYHVTDQRDNTINGWVPSNQVQLSSSNNYFDSRSQVKVNYMYNGNVVKSSNVSVDTSNTKPGYSSDLLNSADNSGKTGLATRINNDAIGNSSSANVTPVNSSSLYNTGYKLGSNVDSSNGNLQYVKVGDTLNVQVQPTETNPALSQLNFNVVNNSISSSTLNTNNVYMPKLTNSQQEQLRGQYYQYVNLDNLLSNGSGSGLFANPSGPSNYTAGLGILYGKDQVATSKINDSIKQGDTFHYEYKLSPDITNAVNGRQADATSNSKTYGQPINVYYTATPVYGSANINGDTSNNNTGYLGN